jgi:putative transposase
MRNLAREHFGVSYGRRQMQRLARELNMYCYKPQPRDYRQADGACCRLKERVQAVADVLRMRGKDLSKMCIGFADESSQQLYGNTARLWSFERGLVKKVNTDKKKRNCFGFYALMGRSVLRFIGKGNQETMRQMLQAIRAANEEAETIVVVWDNHSAHLTASVQAKARELGIVLVNLPPYSPDLNPIERIWKQVKKAISEQALIKTVEELEKIVSTTFESCCRKLSFAKSWVENIYNQGFGNYPIPISDKL